MKLFVTTLASLGILSAAVLSTGSLVSAVTATPQTPVPNNSGQALEIAPPVITLSADPGQSITTQISLRDISPNALIVTGEANDFVAAGEDGTPKLLLEDKETSPYSIKNWFAPLPTLNLIPRQIKSFPVTINVPANAAPGGHYGVIRFTASSPDPTGTAVALNASLGALLLVNVNGDIKNELKVEEFSILKDGKKGKLFESAPLTLRERFKNSGSTHEQPTGQVTLYDMFGKKVAAQNVNQPPRNILPASIRKFEQPIDKALIGDKRLFGRYRADLSVTYANNLKATSSLSFWVIPYKLIAFIILILVGAVVGLRILIVRYNNSVIRRSRGSRRR